MAQTRFRLLALTAACSVVSTGAWGQEPAKADAKAGVAAIVNGEPITNAEVDAIALGKNMQLAQQVYDARKQALDQVIMQRLLGADAKAQGITVDALVEKKLAEKMTPVTDADVQSFYETNKGRMGGQTIDKVSDQIRNYLKSQRETEARKTLLDELKANQKIQITLDAPRADVKVAANDPVKGPADAKVTIVEFSEFQ
jgi:hypothetical protein